MTADASNEPLVFTNPNVDQVIYACPVCFTADVCRGSRNEQTRQYLINKIRTCRHGACHVPYASADLASRIAKARKVTNLEECFGDDSGTFYSSLEDAAEQGETGVFGAELEAFCLDPDTILERILEDHHEDAGPSDLSGLERLLNEVERFNKQQTSGSYNIDYAVWQGIPHVKTFAMIKPCAFQRGDADHIKSCIASAGFRIVQSQPTTLTREDAEWLYREHAAKAHFSDLVDFTISGPVELLVLEGQGSNVPFDFRSLMGPTDLSKAAPDTLRAKFAEDFRRNAIHGSDGPASAVDELCYFSGHFQAS